MTRRLSILGLSAALIAGAIAVLYLVLIAQGAVGVSGDEPRVAVVALILLGQAVVAGIGAVRRSTRLLASAGLVMLATGVLALFSIGVPLMLAGVLAVLGAFRTHLSK